MVLARPGRLPDRHPPLPSGQSLNPATTSHHARLSFTGHQQGFTHVHPSGLPLARAPGVEPAALRLSPELRTPPSPAAHVKGRGQAIEHGPGTTAQLTSVDLQSGSSLNACDLASHGEEEGTAPVRSSCRRVRRQPLDTRPAARPLVGPVSTSRLVAASVRVRPAPASASIRAAQPRRRRAMADDRS